MITKSHNHHHFWVYHCVIYESYLTIRGMRFRPLFEVLWPDTESVSDDDLKKINELLK